MCMGYVAQTHGAPWGNSSRTVLPLRFLLCVWSLRVTRVAEARWSVLSSSKLSTQVYRLRRRGCDAGMESVFCPFYSWLRVPPVCKLAVTRTNS